MPQYPALYFSPQQVLGQSALERDRRRGLAIVRRLRFLPAIFWPTRFGISASNLAGRPSLLAVRERQREAPSLAQHTARRLGGGRFVTVVRAAFTACRQRCGAFSRKETKQSRLARGLDFRSGQRAREPRGRDTSGKAAATNGGEEGMPIQNSVSASQTSKLGDGHTDGDKDGFGNGWTDCKY